MLTSIKTTAMLVFSKCSRASRPELALIRFSSQFTENHLITEQLGWLIIHHEDVDFLVLAHGMPP